MNNYNIRVKAFFILALLAFTNYAYSDHYNRVFEEYDNCTKACDTAKDASLNLIGCSGCRKIPKTSPF